MAIAIAISFSIELRVVSTRKKNRYIGTYTFSSDFYQDEVKSRFAIYTSNPTIV